LWHSGLAKDIEDLWEPWMKEVDQLLANLKAGIFPQVFYFAGSFTVLS
jgi:hypothetical protein